MNLYLFIPRKHLIQNILNFLPYLHIFYVVTLILTIYLQLNYELCSKLSQKRILIFLCLPINCTRLELWHVKNKDSIHHSTVLFFKLY